MSNGLIDNLGIMTNAEIIGLAKNRFLDESTQVAIAKHHYRRAHLYLCTNRGLKPKARDVLWNYKGYALKCELLTYGHFTNQPKKYEELYQKYGSQIRSRSSWRMSRTFLESWCYWSHGHTSRSTGCQGTPASVLEDIYNKGIEFYSESDSRRAWETTRHENLLIQHENTPTDVVVKISASSLNPDTRNKALKRLGLESSIRH